MPRGADVPYYSDKRPVVVWTCEKCGEPNAAKDQCCAFCGAPKENTPPEID